MGGAKDAHGVMCGGHFVSTDRVVAGRKLRADQCPHTWLAAKNQNGEHECLNCPARCRRDESGKLEEYDAGLFEEHERGTEFRSRLSPSKKAVR